jgi:hypothetical protein
VATPDLAALTFEPVIYHDNHGEEVEDERPSVLRLEDGISNPFENGIAEIVTRLRTFPDPDRALLNPRLPVQRH